MKRAAIVYYTDRGKVTAEKIASVLRDSYEVSQYRSKCKVEDLFYRVDALIFVGACGIAVRTIAPLLRGKTVDPGVVVVDESGANAIALLSGHIGGANELTRRIASGIGASPVITTATDVNHRFAADEWAKRNELVISSMQAAKRFAADILTQDLPLISDFPIEGKLPNGLYHGKIERNGLAISYQKRAEFENALLLIPKKLHLGIGCKRNTPKENIENAVFRTLEAEKICFEAIQTVASIDVKRDEIGLLEFCQMQKFPLSFYSAEELMALSGEFTSSAFVRANVGTDNVCERAAVLAAGDCAKLIVKKNCLNGVTVAIAQEKWSVCFE